MYGYGYIYGNHNLMSSVLPMLDIITGSTAAYSLRRLKNSATACIRVRRSSDDTEQDINLIGNNLDTASLLTFANGGDAFISKWYDQSGNGIDAIQDLSSAAQPQIVASGVLRVINTSRPAIYFNGSNYLRLNNNASPLIPASNPYSISGVYNVSSGGYILGQYSTGTAGRMGFNYTSLFTNASPSNLNLSNTYTVNNNAVISASRNGTDFETFKNGANKQTATVSNVSVQQIENTIGASWNSYESKTINQQITGYVSELIVFNRQLTDTEHINLYNLDKKYYGF